MTYLLNKKTGLVAEAIYCPSPNQDERPEGSAVELLVIHGISLPPGVFEGRSVIDFFLNGLDPHAHPYFATIAHLKVSSHFFIRRTGELIQFVPTHRRAWHAGRSSFRGREQCNDYSIGIELEGADDIVYSPLQYRVLVQLCQTLMQAYPTIDYRNIVRHSDISPGRKTDPGNAFEWNNFMRSIKKGEEK